MSKLSKNLHRLVIQRAKNRCEYCLSHQNYIMDWLEIDHIYPVAKGGEYLENNL